MRPTSILPASLTAFRRDLLRTIDPQSAPLAQSPDVAFTWPTYYCTIGCAHCNFASRAARAHEPNRALDPWNLTAWLHDAGARTVTLCGGGEPLDTPDFCRSTVEACSHLGLNWGIYTSGASPSLPRDPTAYVEEWLRVRRVDHGGTMSVRLSVDAFHTERLGLGVIANWIGAVTASAPDWRLSLRGLRIVGDDSFRELAALVNGRVIPYGERGLRLLLKDGRRLPIERMAYIIDGRGSLRTLRRRGLELPGPHAAAVNDARKLAGRGHRLGRVLSRRLTVGPKRTDLEIHSDGSVHVLECQPFDHRLTFEDCSWADVRSAYYRDPIIRAVGRGGLEAVAIHIRAAIELGVAPRTTVPYSIERLRDSRTLDWITARLVMAARDEYDESTRALALALLNGVD